MHRASILKNNQETSMTCSCHGKVVVQTFAHQYDAFERRLLTDDVYSEGVLWGQLSTLDV
jgi:hypothetical protein